MFGIGPAIKAISLLIVVIVIAAGLWYVTGLRADLAISEQNNARLQEGVSAQQALMDQMRTDITQIQNINQDLKSENERQQAEVKALNNRFSQNARGEVRDFGALAAERPDAVQRAVNRGTVNAMRCLELASGAPHTEAELAAKTTSEINRECPSIANPNYQPAPGR
jgi:type II secretory pathway pseudopilin PulG